MGGALTDHPSIDFRGIQEVLVIKEKVATQDLRSEYLGTLETCCIFILSSVMLVLLSVFHGFTLSLGTKRSPGFDGSSW